MSISMSFPTGGEVASSSTLDFPQPCRHFTSSEILVATKHFDESLVIGRGGFGKVYKGTIVNGASVLDVAIKRLDSTSNQGALEFWAEVKMLSKLRHCHLVSLIGYCNDQHEMILVYEYMPRGTLEDNLHKRGTSLHWLRRLKICIGAARGLDYLHTGTGVKHGVIHRDVKSSNMLLHENWAAKVSDFGLSKISPINQSSTGVSTSVKGTFGYLDPHYYSTGKLTRKSDVYAFGVVLLEVLCGKRPLDSSIDMERWGLAGWAQNSIKEGRLKQIIDSKLVGRASPKCLKKFAWLANQCLHGNPKQRPTMAEIVLCLESILSLQEKDKDRLQPVGMTIFGRKVPMFPSPSNVERSRLVAVKNLKSLDIYLYYTVGGENQMLHRFDFDTLNAATENFSEANVIRCFRFHMYKGRLQSGQEITIMRTSNKNRYIQEDIMNEVSMLVKLEHENLPSVLGYCIYETTVFLVYEFAPYATLESLFDTECPLLDWDKRYKILLGIARVLLYLHNHAPLRVIHCDLMPGNILLDESLNLKLYNFASARCLAINEPFCIADTIGGTIGYTPLEYYSLQQVSLKTDVFSFGVVILETISGIRLWFIEESDKIASLEQYAKGSLLERRSFRIDPRIDVDSSLMIRFVHIGVLCTQVDVADRPTMEEVIDMLLGISCPTLLLSEILERKSSETLRKKLLNSPNDINASMDDYDVGAVEEFISDLCPR